MELVPRNSRGKEPIEEGETSNAQDIERRVAALERRIRRLEQDTEARLSALEYMTEELVRRIAELSDRNEVLENKILSLEPEQEKSNTGEGLRGKCQKRARPSWYYESPVRRVLRQLEQNKRLKS